MAVQQFPVVKADIASSSNLSLPGWLGPFASRMFGWLNTCRSYFAAAAIYNEMRGLSDAELKRRGLSRDTLARDICEACERGQPR
jgi:hypothetical protein